MKSKVVKTLIAVTLLATAAYQFMLSNYPGGLLFLFLAASPTADRFFIKKSQSVTLAQSLRYFYGMAIVALVVALTMSVTVFASDGVERLLAGAIGLCCWIIVCMGIYVAVKAKKNPELLEK
ncbi:MAG: hypothetical protein WA966_04660 [Ornithinimicrobium sp.]